MLKSHPPAGSLELYHAHIQKPLHLLDANREPVRCPAPALASGTGPGSDVKKLRLESIRDQKWPPSPRRRDLENPGSEPTLAGPGPRSTWAIHVKAKPSPVNGAAGGLASNPFYFGPSTVDFEGPAVKSGSSRPYVNPVAGRRVGDRRLLTNPFGSKKLGQVWLGTLRNRTPVGPWGMNSMLLSGAACGALGHGMWASWQARGTIACSD